MKERGLKKRALVFLRENTGRPRGTIASSVGCVNLGRVGKIAFGEIANKFGRGQGARKEERALL